VGELAVAAVAIARAGDAPVAASARIVGDDDVSARVMPPRATWATALAEGASSEGCVVVAPIALGELWRDIVAGDGPAVTFAAVRGPVFVGTSPTLVTTLAAAAAVLRVVLPAWLDD
jgi:hypothetical protein